jgi:hypothetical protein
MAVLSSESPIFRILGAQPKDRGDEPSLPVIHN